MKKLICVCMAALMLLAGCGSRGSDTSTETTPQPAGFTGTMEELAEKIYENHGALEVMVGTIPVDLTDGDAVSYNLGLSDASRISDAVLSEPMIGSIPYSLALVRVKDAADAEAVAAEMKQNIDPRKWVCVEADTQTAAYCGDVVMFFMVGSNYESQVTTDTMTQAFAAAMGGTVTPVA